MAGIAAKSYCDALFEIAKEENKLDVYKEQLCLVNDVVANDHKFQNVMNHPKIHKEEKKALLETVFHDQLEHMLLNFMKLLVDKNRFRMLKDITSEFVKAYNLANDIQVVYVKSACELSGNDAKRLQETLEKKLEKRIELVCSVDEDLLAGIRIKINDQVIDNSARAKLNRLKKDVVTSEADK